MDHPCAVDKRWSGLITVVSHLYGPWRGIPFDSEERACTRCGKIEIRMLTHEGNPLPKRKRKVKA